MFSKVLVAVAVALATVAPASALFDASAGVNLFGSGFGEETEYEVDCEGTEAMACAECICMVDFSCDEEITTECTLKMLGCMSYLSCGGVDDLLDSIGASMGDLDSLMAGVGDALNNPMDTSLGKEMIDTLTEGGCDLLALAKTGLTMAMNAAAAQGCRRQRRDAHDAAMADAMAAAQDALAGGGLDLAALMENAMAGFDGDDEVMGGLDGLSGIMDGCRRQRRDAHVSDEMDAAMADAMAAAQDALAGGGLDLDSLMGGLGDIMGGLADGSGLGGLGTNVNLDLATSMDELGLGGIAKAGIADGCRRQRRFAHEGAASGLGALMGGTGNSVEDAIAAMQDAMAGGDAFDSTDWEVDGLDALSFENNFVNNLPSAGISCDCLNFAIQAAENGVLAAGGTQADVIGAKAQAAGAAATTATVAVVIAVVAAIVF